MQQISLPLHFMHFLPVIAASGFWQGAGFVAAYKQAEPRRRPGCPWSSGAGWQQRWMCSALLQGECFSGAFLSMQKQFLETGFFILLNSQSQNLSSGVSPSLLQLLNSS